MKRTGTLFLLFLLLGTALRAQEISYALPATSVTVKVEVRQESFFAGPYAAYAKRMLNISVQDKDQVSAVLTGVELIPHVEADTQAWHTCEGESAALLSLSAQGLISLGNQAPRTDWRFLPGLSGDFTGNGLTSPQREETRIEYRNVQTDTAIVRVPVEHKVLVDKTLEEKAQAAAKMILSVREERLNIATGNTDANYSGEALQAALKELDRTEQEYMALFRGYSVVRYLTATYEVVPASTVNEHRYLVFRLTDEGPVGSGVKGVPYYLELHPEGTLPEENQDRRKGRGAVRYRIPQVCRTVLTENTTPILQTRIPFYQLGRESTLYLTK